ncbi:MAG: hypothetical protein CHACPFDD_03826 [Phycisphaerae bacterium]|nr:hypothetical protein [Phycisphaerae bacterium]
MSATWSRTLCRVAPMAIVAALVGLTASAEDRRVAAAGPQPRYVAQAGVQEFSGEMIVRPIQVAAWLEQKLPAAEAAARRAAADAALAGYAVHAYVPQTDEYIVQVPAGSDENATSAALLATGLFQYAEPNWILYPIACSNDPQLGSQWHHNANRMQSCDGWGIHTGNPTVSVGICDTGVLTTHQDLQLHRLEGYNAVDQLWESQGGQIGPVHSHGTQTTGCAAANGNNAVGVSGVGWNLSHRMLRVSNVSTGSSSQAVLQHAARTAIESGDRVASVSYSGVDSASNLTTATYIKSIGGLLVWAAGNDNRNLTLGNRDADDIIVAAATDQNDAKASFSAYGVFVDVAAPGVSVYTTSSASTSSYAAVSGTSFACPLTAGLVALIWSADPTLTPDEVETVLKSSCTDLGTAGVDNTFGYGRINVYNAMVLAGGGGITDCNGNGVEDADDIANGTSQDCNGNGVPDECDLANGTSQDCNGNGIPDSCDIANGTSADCNGNGVPDDCDISSGTSQDCNGNGIPDSCDIANGTSSDANGNGVPDECDPPPGTEVWWLTFQSSTTLPVLGTVAAADIVSFDESTGVWGMVFDGSDVGVGSLVIDGMARMADGSILLSFSSSATITGVGTADDSDIVRFVPTSLGANTAGSFSLYFDGSDVGLSTSNEDVDAVGLTADGRIVISMLGSFSVNGASGNDEDMVVFNATSLGSTTAGTFAMYFDGSDVGVSASGENIDGTCVLADGSVLLTTSGSFSVTGAAGSDEDILQFVPTSLGSTTAGTFSLRLDLSVEGVTNDVHGVALVTP